MPTYDTLLFTAPMPNIENLKKQAKQYLRWHRERHYPVVAKIRAALPRFTNLSDAQVLDATFKLADAQDLVARERGFEGWQALKSGAHAMSPKASPTVRRPTFSSTEAQLFVADINASCDFYTGKLAFTMPSSMAIRPSMARSLAAVRGLICGWSASRCSPAIFASVSSCSLRPSPSLPRTKSSSFS